MPPLLNYYKSKGGTPMEKLRNLSVLAKLIILLVLLADLSLVVPACFSRCPLVSHIMHMD